MTGTSASSTPSTGAGAGSSNSTDPWTLATGPTYDPDKVYTRASDDKGHSKLMHVPVSTNLHGEIRALIEGKHIPELRTHADVVRDALIHRMVHYRKMLKAQGVSTGTLSTAITTEVREAQLDEIANKTATWGRIIDKLDARLTELTQLRDYDTAWEIVDCNSDPDDMSEPFARRLAEVIAKHTAVLRTVANRLPVIEDTPYRDADNVTHLRPA